LAKQLKTIYPAGVRLINLQYGDVQVDIEDCLKETGVLVEQIGSVDNFTDLDGLASLIQACDEVVSVDNSTVHLAGALGQKVTALLPFNADWRWFDNTTQSLWYPSVRLLRQASLGDWDSCWLK
jgi:ADP-heptose:LPS heptosyltransferase